MRQCFISKGEICPIWAIFPPPSIFYLLIFSKIPTFETERLILRPMRMFDAFDMYEYSRMPETSRFLTWSPHSDIEYTKNYLAFVIDKCRAGEFYDWAGVLKGEEEKMIGTCGFSRIDFTNDVGEIGYVINPEYRSHGYAAEKAGKVNDSQREAGYRTYPYRTGAL